MSSQSVTIVDDGHYDVRNISWREALERYGDHFTSLVQSGQLSPTHLPGWLDVVISTRDLAAMVRVLLLEQNGRIVAAVPYYVTKEVVFGISLTVVELATNIVSYHASPIARTGLTRIWQGLSACVPEWHVIRVLNFVEGADQSQVLLHFVERGSHYVETLPTEQSPYLPIQSDWDSFLMSKSKKFRYKLRQRDKVLRSDPGLTVDTITAENFRQDVLEEILAIESASWKGKYALDIAARPEERAYYEALLPYLANTGFLHLVMLYKDKRPIAYSLCANFNGWFGQLKTSFDEGFSALSPGAIVIDKSIQAAFAMSAKEFDFLGDMDQHKLGWTRSSRKHASYFIYRNTLKSTLVYFAKRLKKAILPAKRVATTKPS